MEKVRLGASGKVLPFLLVTTFVGCGGGSTPGDGIDPPKNQPPVLTVAGPGETVAEGDRIEFHLTASDPDGDTPEFGLTGSTGGNIAFTVEPSQMSQFRMSFTAPPVEETTTMTFSVTASDGKASATREVLVTVSPLSGQIVFREDVTPQALWRLNPDGGEMKKLYEAETIADWSASPDGRWLLVTVPDEVSTVRHLLVNAASGESFDLFEGMGNPSVQLNGDVHWFADSGSFVFLADGRFPGVDELYAVTTPMADSASRHRISGELHDPDGDGGEPPANGVDAFVPSTAGGRVALLGKLDDPDIAGVFVTDLSGNRVRVFPGEAGIESDLPSWSYNDAYLAFAHDGGKKLFIARVGETDGALERAIFDGGVEISGIAWSPKASELVFSTRATSPGSYSQLFWLSAETPDDPRLISGEIGDWPDLLSPGARIMQIGWSPNGQRLLFSALDFEEPLATTKLYDASAGVVGDTLARPSRLTPADQLVQRFQWSPDGEWLALRDHRSLSMLAAGSTTVPTTVFDGLLASCKFNDETEFADAVWRSGANETSLFTHCPTEALGNNPLHEYLPAQNETRLWTAEGNVALYFVPAEDRITLLVDDETCNLWSVTEATRGAPQCLLPDWSVMLERPVVIQ